MKAKLVTTVFSLNLLPAPTIPEVVICGRSNVGKSSFINSFLNNKNLAKTSSTPGKTKSINFFLVENDFLFVDLPGYGFAKVSESEKQKWGKNISSFLRMNRPFVLIIHLIDSRHAPTKLDLTMHEMIVALGLKNIKVFTKIDKLNQSELKKANVNAQLYFPELSEEGGIFYYSSVTGKGKKEISKKIINEIELFRKGIRVN